MSGKKVVEKSRGTIWILGSAFSAALLPMIGCTIVTVGWFIMFYLPFADWFPALFPVSQFMWFVLLYAIAQTGILMHLNSTRHDEQRHTMYAQFRAKLLTLANSDMDPKAKNTLKRLPKFYIDLHRDRVPDANSRMLTALSSVGPNALALMEIWLRSVDVEKHRKSIILHSLAYVCVWLFVLSVPFVLWGSYNWYGLFGLLLVDWPLLAFIYGPGRTVNQYSNYEESAFITTNYNELAQECSELLSLQLQ